MTLEELTRKHQEACQGEFQAREVFCTSCSKVGSSWHCTLQALADERRAHEEDKAAFDNRLGELENQVKMMDTEVSTRDAVLRQLQEEVSLLETESWPFTQCDYSRVTATVAVVGR